MSASTTKSEGDRPSEYVVVYVSRRAAETVEQELSVMPPGAARAVMLKALRNALKKNAGAKHYPWQKDAPARCEASADNLKHPEEAP